MNRAGPDFPPDFFWGAATSAHQVEGGNVNNDWWDFEHDPRSAARESSGDAIDHLHRYAEDVALLKSLHHNAHRLSLEWSRIEPAPGEFSRSAIAHYRRVLTALGQAGLTPFVTLQHFTLPRWFAGAGGGLTVQMPLLATIREDDACRTLLDLMQHEVIDLYLDGLIGPDRGDWLGVQYYRKQWVDPASPTWFADPPGEVPITQMGWAVFPDGLRQVLHRAADRTGLPLFVSENGIATDDDTERLDYLEGHLHAIRQARQEGVDVRGYLHWSAFDNLEWAEGFRPKFGLIAVDPARDYTRVPKPSAHAFARIAATGRLDTLRS